MHREPIDILLVEDNPGDVRLVEVMLGESETDHFRIVHVSTVRDALDRLSNHARTPDAVLLDLTLPDESGLETLRRVLAAAGPAGVVVMTGVGDEDLGVAALKAGAEDYLVKGQVDGRALRRSLRFAIERHGMRLDLVNKSIKDDLTGLYNRRGFLVLAEQQIKVARRSGTSFLVLFVDLDDLKDINDTFGHSEGNRALAEAAEVLRASFRQSDIVARLGGDEFAALAIASTGSDEAAIRSRLRAALATVNAKPDRAYPLGFSVGVLPSSTDGVASMEELLARADALMYAEKKLKGKKIRLM